MSVFENLQALEEDSILKLAGLYHADKRDHKVSLGIGVYRDANSRPHILKSVKQAETFLTKNTVSKEYLPGNGEKTYLEAICELLIGPDLFSKFFERMAWCQTIGGTGALHLGAIFFAKCIPKTIYIPRPTWSNHIAIFENVGYDVKFYDYYDTSIHELTLDKLLAELHEAKPKSLVILHTCCHNPSGQDLSQGDWKKIAAVCKEKQLIAFFDCAYQGFAKHLHEDAWPIQYFLQQGLEFAVAYSFSKNFGLYGDRVGALGIHCADAHEKPILETHFRHLVRREYSSPPMQGSLIVQTILTHPELKKLWIEELQSMKKRVDDMRQLFVSAFHCQTDKWNYEFVRKQKGMFSLLGLTAKQVNFLIQNYAIYLPANGRINFAGLTSENIDYVIESLIAVLELR